MPKEKKGERLKPISLYPLKLEEAIKAIMQVKPEKIVKSEKDAQKK
ncbi:MAG: hypothetical protein HQK94_17935 [Nitrospirae bacterium]|nr:hypothetical protein [Nitrospirota bacterium]